MEVLQLSVTFSSTFFGLLFLEQLQCDHCYTKTGHDLRLTFSSIIMSLNASEFPSFTYNWVIVSKFEQSLFGFKMSLCSTLFGPIQFPMLRLVLPTTYLTCLKMLFSKCCFPRLS